MRTASAILCAALLAAVPASPAVAADFTLDVPVRLENVPSISRVTINCLVSRQLLEGDTPSGLANVIGRGQAVIDVVGGRYDGTVTIEIENTGFIPSSAARSYSCSMDAVGRATTGAGYTASSGNFEDIYQTATGQRLERFTTTAMANLP
jgi:hypothetical protein